ncbi:MAG TPA: periplasmic heavy metal sensor [Vicinamibacterales bacterium]|jgi:Spy/CpxP family protein refolding chaperone|nr:periplasmic heavy metal sensor [Vicinamibacterales bacterium]
MNRFRSLTAGVLVAGLFAGGVAFAQGPAASGRPAGAPAFGRGGRPGGPGGRGDVGLPLPQLNLSDTQRQQIRDLVQLRLQDGKDVQDRLHAAQDAMRKATEALPINEGAIRAAAQTLSLAEADAAVQQARVRGEVFALLTPDQQAQAQKLQQDRDARVSARENRQEQRRDRFAQRQPRQQ